MRSPALTRKSEAASVGGFTILRYPRRDETSDERIRVPHVARLAHPREGGATRHVYAPDRVRPAELAIAIALQGLGTAAGYLHRRCVQHGVRMQRPRQGIRPV